MMVGTAGIADDAAQVLRPRCAPPPHTHAPLPFPILPLLLLPPLRPLSSCDTSLQEAAVASTDCLVRPLCVASPAMRSTSTSRSPPSPPLLSLPDLAPPSPALRQGARGHCPLACVCVCEAKGNLAGGSGQHGEGAGPASTHCLACSLSSLCLCCSFTSSPEALSSSPAFPTSRSRSERQRAVT